MTRTGKSNTIKKIIQANEKMSAGAPLQLGKAKEKPEEILSPFTTDGKPKYPIGQIIFDMNGEYANSNLQDAGTAIFDLYKEKTVRYSIIEKPGFKVMKVNFFEEIDAGFELIRAFPRIADDSSRYVANFRSVILEKPGDYQSNRSAKERYDRKVGVYHCILAKAGFKPPAGLKIKFSANKEVRAEVNAAVDPSTGMTPADAAEWWTTLWNIYESAQCFTTYRQSKGREWADDDLKALLVMLTRCRTSGGGADCSGYLVLREISPQHTDTVQIPFEVDILDNLRQGQIIIADLSSGDEELQRMYSERITRHIFRDSMRRFTEATPNNFIQFYFEEAHNLFPKKEDKDLAQIYNRLAKEGAKLHLGLVFATQELSSISGNILKNTQNWFISHLNNEDEIRELRKYYDFGDFSDGLIRFSQDTDKGFARIKTYSNAFVVPAQVDKFPGDANA
jgi:DNA helicase HerA-like ATPase